MNYLLMNNLTLPTLGIKILLNCKSKPLSMRDITQMYKTYKKSERDEVLEHLIAKNYIESIKMPKPNTKKTPTYYVITENGKIWIEKYLDFFNKK